MRLPTPTLATSLSAAILAAAAVGLSGCGGGEPVAFGKVVPDEFRVVTKAPLTLPPDYSLRPPMPGEPRPQELQPESAARQALLGEQARTERSQGEKLLVAKAGADKADPLIRYVVDDEFGETAHKDKSFADKVMFWKKSEPRQVQLASSAPIDAAAEDARIKAMLGDLPVVIRREPEKKGFKLPGL